MHWPVREHPAGGSSGSACSCCASQVSSRPDRRSAAPVVAEEGRAWRSRLLSPGSLLPEGPGARVLPAMEHAPRARCRRGAAASTLRRPAVAADPASVSLPSDQRECAGTAPGITASRHPAVVTRRSKLQPVTIAVLSGELIVLMVSAEYKQ